MSHENDTLDKYVDYLDAVQKMADEYVKTQHDAYIFQEAVNSLAERLQREFAGSDRDAGIEYIAQYFGGEAKYHALKRLKELDNPQSHHSSNGKPLNSYLFWERLEMTPAEPEPILENVFDVSDKVCVIGTPKCRKSFFVLQLGMSLAAGIDFLYWKTVKPRRTFLIQQEITPLHFHRRIRNLGTAAGFCGVENKAPFWGLDTRGFDISFKKLREKIMPAEPEVIIFDPLYKLLTGDENKAQDMKPVLAQFDELATELNAAVVYVHHDPKGLSGAKQLQDRGAGSGVLGRDYDASFFLTAHREERDTLVVETLFRNYAECGAVSIKWEENHFKTTSTPPIVQVMPQRTGSRMSPLLRVPAALRLIESTSISLAVFRDEICAQLGISIREQRNLISLMETAKQIEIIPGNRKEKQPNMVQITELGLDAITSDNIRRDCK